MRMLPLTPSWVCLRAFWLVAGWFCIQVYCGAAMRPERHGANPPPSHATAAEIDSTWAPALAYFSRLNATEQATQLTTETQSGELARLPDDQVMRLMRAVKPEAFVAWIKGNIAALHSYEFHMYRQERLGRHWQVTPDHILVRYQYQPRRLYMKWLSDGAHAGQEAIYDETRDPDHLYGHRGGILSFYSTHTEINSAFARSQSRHSIRDLGFQFIEKTIEHDTLSFRAEGLSDAPTHIAFVRLHGLRVVALTWDAPSGPPAHYARRVTLYFDLKHLWPRGEEAWDENDNPLEALYFEDVAPQVWGDETFDPKNPGYRF